MAASLLDLKYFRAIIDHKTLSAAGDAVGISQPALSKCLRRLEQTYGGALVEWRGGAAQPTDIGTIVYRYSNEILFRSDDLTRRVQSVANGDVASIRVGFGPYIAEAAGKRAIAAFMREHPASTISVSIAPWNQLCRLLYEEQLDFFVADIGDTLLNSDMDVKPVGNHPARWFCRAGHPLAKLKKVSLQRLTEFPICGPDVPARGKKYLLDIKRAGAGPRQVASDVHLSVICDSWSMLRHVASTSDCVSIAPDRVFRDDVAEGRLVILNVATEPFIARFGVVRIRSAPIARLTEELIRMISEEIN